MIIRDDLTEHNNDEEINEVEVHTLICISLKDKKDSKQSFIYRCYKKVMGLIIFMGKKFMKINNIVNWFFVHFL